MAPAGVGERAWTDGVTIFIDSDADPSHQVATLAVQSSLIGADSLNSAVLAALTRRPALARRYLAVEGQRALSRHEDLLPTSVRPLIDRTLALRTASPVESLAIAGSHEHLDAPPESFGTIVPRRVASSSAPWRGEDEAPHRHAPRSHDQAQLRELDGDDDDDSFAADILSSPVGSGGGIGRLIKRLLGDARSGGDAPPGADASTHWSGRGRPTSRTRWLSTTAAPAPRGTVDIERSGITYPEWDRNKRRYKLDWCTVEEMDAPVSKLAPFTPADTLGLRRALGRLGMEFQRHHRQRQGNDVDIDAAVESQVQLRAGSVPDEAVYIDTLRCRRDLSVLLLLDISGSAGEPSATGVPVHEHQRAAAATLGVGLYELGDRVALYGFRSQGRSAVHIVPVMRFGKKPDALVMQRLGALVPGAYTRLGAAIRHGTAVLEQDAGTARRLLVVLSDGLAYDHGYERSYGEADVRRALAEARRRGIGCLCLSVGARTDAGALHAGLRNRSPCRHSQGGPAPAGRRPSVPIRPPLGRTPAEAVPGAGADENAPWRREKNRMNRGTRPYYVPVGSEEQVFKAAFRQGLAILLKGPTGCGKTRFVEAMAFDLERPMITVACHDDLTTADLVGRFLIQGGDTAWVDGPLTRAVREGAICYLDEIVEARQDTTVVLHPLADHRRQMPIDRLGVTLDAAPEFCLVVSYNPGYQSVLKDLKDSTRQRLVAIELDFAPPDVETKIVVHEAGVDLQIAASLVQLGQAIRRLDNVGLREVASTRLLVAAGRLVAEGLGLRDATRAAVAGPLTDDPIVTAGLFEMINAYVDDQTGSYGD